jgi:hypothetical protein
MIFELKIITDTLFLFLVFVSLATPIILPFLITKKALVLLESIFANSESVS